MATRLDQEEWMARGHDPLIQRRRLRSELRRLRRATGRTQKDVAEALDWSSSKVVRIETGAVGVSITDLRALLGHFGVTDRAYVDDLVEAARDSKKAPWWSGYKDILDPQFQALLGFEGAAAIIREFHPLLIPGLLQTEEYTRALFKEQGANLEIDDRPVRARLERQRLLTYDDRPEMFFVLDEAAIRRHIGGPEVMTRQLEHLKELGRQPGISIQVITFNTGAHSGLWGPFIIFELSNDREDSIRDEFIVFLENAGDDYLIRDDPEQSSIYVERFLRLEQIATPGGGIDKVVDDAIRHMS